ncbi:CBS domain-containing protein [Caldalkalibacillus mannanilyticus]|uniref:CBS domain-containing protein n=1 Tax=Caldalkalibacillus mannanilyticus TaxID=1418 RepID=UPI000468F858|nr:CBS domain-containing protein [Caldalkalibacillus mannanilyticus]
MPRVGDFYQNITNNPSTVLADDSIRLVRQKMSGVDPIYRSIYVIDQDTTLIGIITLKELLKVLAVRSGVNSGKAVSKGKLLDYVSLNSTAKDIMIPPISVRKSDSLEKALELFIVHGLEELPVVDEKNILIGDLDAYELVREMN